MKKIHVEARTEKIIKNRRPHLIRMHYVYLLDGGRKTFLFKQRWYYGVDQYFHRDLPLGAILSRRTDRGRDKMVTHLLERLPRCLAEAERQADSYAA